MYFRVVRQDGLGEGEKRMADAVCVLCVSVR